MIRSIHVLAFVSLFTTLTLAPQIASAQVKPFKISGCGIADAMPLTPGQVVAHQSVGVATHLGAHTGQGRLKLGIFTSPTTATFSSEVPYVFKAANGDQLACTYGLDGTTVTGKVELFRPNPLLPIAYAVFVAEFKPVPAQCTGRFAKVIGGSFLMTAVSEPFDLRNPVNVRYCWEGDGTLKFATR